MPVKLLIAGIPNSGKSTFIAALRYLLTSGETSTALSLARLSADEAHFNLLQERWLEAEEVERTKPPTEKWVTFHLLDSLGGTEVEVVVPDLRGEWFEQPAAAGLCHEELYTALVACDGLLLFTNADTAADDLLVSDVTDIVNALDGTSAPPAAPAEQITERLPTPTAFNPDEMPEAAKLVELLQMMNRAPLRGRPRKLAVVVSAWDVVAALGPTTPQEWLREHRPMLSQFLENNSGLWEARVYGVSAQGGALPAERDRLKDIERPSERIGIVGPEALPHDLTTPIHWLMRNDTG